MSELFQSMRTIEKSRRFLLGENKDITQFGRLLRSWLKVRKYPPPLNFPLSYIDFVTRVFGIFLHS